MFLCPERNIFVIGNITNVTLGGSTGTISSDDSNRRQKSNTEGKWSQKDDIIDNNSGQVESDSDDESDDGWPQEEPELCAKHEVPKSRCSHCQDKRFWVNRAGGTTA